MRYAQWNKLSDEEKQNAHWRHHPRVRIATIFTVLFAVVFALVLFRIFQNKRVHVNRKPNAAETFAIARLFVLDSRKAAFIGNLPKK